MEQTSREYDAIIQICSKVFTDKMKDYGTAWRILRPSSVTDQIFIKATRIRSIEMKGNQKVEDDIRSEFIGIINYSIMALIQLDLGVVDNPELDHPKVIELYNRFFTQAKQLMEDKNHDYDEAWRLMRISSYTDLILMKLNRVKQIEDNQGKTLVSEGIDANFFDMINYAVFAMIKLEFETP
ncbi:MAG: DUF1599 domain-containing protein [Bacteroidales bacterium]|nr:DUF1599 domain-containing protein [Bacteroidales bacterium]